jgi:hypothetical protein
VKDNKKQWKPKTRWIESITITLKQPGKAKYEYYIPKTEEEEKKMQADWDQKMEDTLNIIFSEGPYKALQDIKKQNK